ncbi:hypothetical protein [Cryptosporangium phraense]|uniref:Uncharacterized protein n=1 Tax=Cryptosporangium phraense TaxID=2593070 RepID=A0A545AQK3_9ACTN|nr:hypothetical protein [Cryptosporangium phraense]TQS43606.1 hypothetical protein FL583_18395 [Cryptosporangium phraense]
MAIRVDPAALLRASGAADRLADGVRKDASDIEAETDVAVRALSGFRTGDVLDRLRSGWTDALGRHRDYLDRLSGALADAARGYRRSDAETAAELDRF